MSPEIGLQGSLERQRQLHMMNREERMLLREAYGALENKRTLCFNQGQPEDEETDDKDVYIMVRTAATGTQDTTVHQENTQLDKTTCTSSERLQGSPERQRQLHMMTREESMLPRELYDALEHKHTLHLNQGQPEDEKTNEKDVYIMVRTTAPGTQDTTVRQENTQLDKTNRTFSETAPIPNVRHSPGIPLGRRSEPIVINDNDIICGICNNNIVRNIDMGQIFSDGCKCNLSYHYNCLLTMRNRYVQQKKEYEMLNVTMSKTNLCHHKSQEKGFNW